MKASRMSPWAVVLGLLVLSPSSAFATNGHFLHGVGAVNSALGGTGVASNTSLLGAFFVNPASRWASNCCGRSERCRAAPDPSPVRRRA
jgi:hypothetical protein